MSIFVLVALRNYLRKLPKGSKFKKDAVLISQLLFVVGYQGTGTFLKTKVVTIFIMTYYCEKACP